MITMLGLLVLVGVGIASKGRLIEEWYLYKLRAGTREDRQAATEALFEMRSVRALVPIMESIEDDQLRSLLTWIRTPSGIPGPAQFQPLRLGLRNACANWSQEAVHEFVKGLSHPDPVVGAISACSLMHVKEAGEAVMTALSAAVHDGANEIVRFEAARSIAEINFRS